MVPKWVMDSSEKLPLLVISKQQIYSFPFSLCVCACELSHFLTRYFTSDL